MTQPTASQWQDWIERIQQRARTDQIFHDLCATHPDQAFRRVAGTDPPAGLSLRFVPMARGERLIPLPPLAPGAAAGELASAALEQVVGGTYLTAEQKVEQGFW
jgi:hypothetical protein